jgi:hypothetical protein
VRLVENIHKNVQKNGIELIHFLLRECRLDEVLNKQNDFDEKSEEPRGF